MYGESNSKPLLSTLDLIKTTNDGISNAIKSSANLRGLLKFTQSMLKPEDLKKQRDDFVKDYMDVNNNGGVAALDSKADYIELKGDAKLVNAPQMKVIEEKVYKYFNVNENIVMSRYSEDEWNAFYESVIEPIAIQLSLEFTSKCFSDREIGFRNEIIFESNRLAYASNSTKISLARELMPMGVFTVNEIRDVFNLAPVEGGDKRIQTLNVVSADKADDYQGVKDGKGDEADAGEGDTKQGTQKE
jgi:HK97 family phage portal protein